MTENQSIFARYYSDEPFVDRYATYPEGAVDIIIPVLHSNELWRKNLISIYREVPVHRLILGDAGCKDDTLRIAGYFPRVEIKDQSAYKSLGYSVRELIEAVQTDWFLYLHSDVYLPEGWFDVMRAHQHEYDWFGCPMRITALIEYPLNDKIRPYAGSQMGRKGAFMGGLERIDDDYVYRQEDWVFAQLIEDRGFRHGKIEDTFHWHQMMPRVYGDQRRVRKFPRVRIDVEMTEEEEILTADTQLRGTVKYLPPDSNQVSGARENFFFLKKKGALELKDFYRWVALTNPHWLPHFIESPVGLQALKQRAVAAVFSNTGNGRRTPPPSDIVAGSDRKEVQTELTFLKSIVQFLNPDQAQDLTPELNESIATLAKLGAWEPAQFANWVKKTNSAWSPYFVTDGRSVSATAPLKTKSANPAEASLFIKKQQTVLSLVTSSLSLLFLGAVIAMLWPLVRSSYRVLFRLAHPLIENFGHTTVFSGPRRIVRKFKSLDGRVRGLMIEQCRLMAAKFEQLASQL